MIRWRRSLSARLALAFTLASALLLGAISLYLYQSLKQEISWRDDQALIGRLQRLQALINDRDSIDALRDRPQLYENMLGNQENLLWIVGDDGQKLIEINPAHVPIPAFTSDSRIRLTDGEGPAPVRYAWLHIERNNQGMTLISGKMLAEREQMLAAYRLKLWLALGTGSFMAFLLGWLVSQRGLRPVRELAEHAAKVDIQHLHLRVGNDSDLSELRHLASALNQMLSRLEDGFSQLARFSEDLAHEMRTPLSNLMGYTQQTLRKARSVEEYQNLLVSHLEEYERLSRMINSMLFLARSEKPNASLSREKIDLHQLVAQLCEYFEGMAEERDIALVNQATGWMEADPDLLGRALANLLANAMRYGEPGHPVHIVSKVGEDAIDITVQNANAGEPIPEEHLPHLFERFYRCDPARAEPGDSGGLGLAIVQSIMQLHGGSARVESDRHGTRFTLTFPMTHRPS